MADSALLLDGAGAPRGGEKGKAYYMRSLIVMSASFFLVYTAFSAIQNLSGAFIGPAGSKSVSVLYFVFAASCIGGPSVVDYLGARWSLFTGFLFIAAYCVANWVATTAPDDNSLQYAVLLPTAALLGFGASFLWTAQGSYLTTASEHYALASGLKQKAALGSFNGIFWAFFQTTQLSGNLLEPLVNDATNNSTSAVFMVYAAFAVAGTALIVFLPGIEKVKAAATGAAKPAAREASATLEIESVDEDRDSKTLIQKFADVIRLWTDRRFMWFIPVIILSGVEQGFVWNDFTTYYVQPGLSKKDTGYIMAVFGACDALASFSMGKLSDKFGRAPVLTIGFFCQTLVISFFIWSGAPVAGTTDTFWSWGGHWGSLTAAAALWGIGDAVWNTQISALLGDVFSDDSGPAFANFKLWQSLAVATTFLYNGELAILTKQLIVYLSLCIGYTCARFAAINAKEANERAEARLKSYARDDDDV